MFSCSYDNSTGLFTVPPCGDGLLYVSTYLAVSAGGEFGRFSIVVNGVTTRTAYGDHSSVGSDTSQATCSAIVDVAEGRSRALLIFQETKLFYLVLF